MARVGRKKNEKETVCTVRQMHRQRNHDSRKTSDFRLGIINFMNFHHQTKSSGTVRPPEIDFSSPVSSVCRLETNK